MQLLHALFSRVNTNLEAELKAVRSPMDSGSVRKNARAIVFIILLVDSLLMCIGESDLVMLPKYIYIKQAYRSTLTRKNNCLSQVLDRAALIILRFRSS